MHTAETFFHLYRHTEQDTLTAQKARIWPYIPWQAQYYEQRYKKRTRHFGVLHSVNSILCVKIKLLLYLDKHPAMKAYWGSQGIPIVGTKWRRVTTLRARRFTSSKQPPEPIR